MVSGDVSHKKIMKSWPGSCFACSNPAGLQLKFWHAPEGVETKCEVSAAYCGFDVVVHGGIIATILDEAPCWAIFAKLGRLGVTQKMTSQYHRPVQTETEFSVNARVSSHDARHALVRAEISDAEGTVLAESESSWVFPRLSRIASLAGADEKMLQSFLNDCCPGK
jgi:acyl-CoA thioesterase FadM